MFWVYGVGQFVIVETDNFEVTPGDQNSYCPNLKCLSEVFKNVRDNSHADYEETSRHFNLRKRGFPFK